MDEFGGYEEPTSRAFWGSEDPEEESTTGPTFSLEWSEDLPKSIKTFVLVAGNVVTDISNKYAIPDAPKVCTVNSTEEFNVAAFYKLANDVYVCNVSKSVDVTSAGRFIQTISDVISRSEKTFVFTDEEMTRLTGPERNNVDGPTLWKSLSSSKAREKGLSKISTLKHPNFVVGVAAGVIGSAEMLQVAATLYILYVSGDAYENETRDAMLKLFAEVTESPVPKIGPNAKKFDNNKLKLYI